MLSCLKKALCFSNLWNKICYLYIIYETHHLSGKIQKNYYLTNICLNEKKILITGSQGFIGSYICKELLENDYIVTGVDNFSKYGHLIRGHDNHKNFTLINTDCSNQTFLVKIKEYDFDYIIAGAAMIGGISYFHKYAYDLIASNERIIANTFNLAISRFRKNELKKFSF